MSNKRIKLTKKKSEKLFTKGAQNVQSVNLKMKPTRGGYRF